MPKKINIELSKSCSIRFYCKRCHHTTWHTLNMRVVDGKKMITLDCTHSYVTYHKMYCTKRTTLLEA